MAATHISDRESVLVLAGPVTVGQKLSEQDLHDISVSADSNLAAISARSRPDVVGRSAAYTLPAGTLLTKDVLGAPRTPPVGQAVAAVALKAGQYPHELRAGAWVTVVAASTDAATGARKAGSSAWRATVTDVHANAGERLTEVSLQMAEADARELAAKPSDRISLVVVEGGGE
ncbi:SAF domain-containing protein [Streptomyces sp. NBC_00287]|uniref:SAF domain-containing protein n=1 Tax=Streptomyces sp. NBC_00287 TaxID=2975702 RepID=UPI002E2B2452|nr:SAF domain-containing protein [Streptomyces sp. NBC_00287]